MKTTIQTAGKAGLDKDSLVLVLRDLKSLPANLFSKDELGYIRSRSEDKKKTQVINQYNRLICLHVADAAKGEAEMMESSRKAGEAFAGALNKAKATRARIIEAAPHLMRISKELARFAVHHAEDTPTELLDLAKKSTMLLRRIYDTPAPSMAAPQAAE